MDIFKKDYVAGLDIGSSSVRLALFSMNEAGVRLLRAQMKEIEGPGSDPADESQTLSAISYLFKDIDVKKTKVIVAINCPQTAIRKITAPYMPKSELAEGVRLEARSYFPFPIDNASLDFEILRDVVDKGVRKYEVLAATCPVGTSLRYLSLLGKAGIRPASFVPASFALYRMALACPSAKGKTVCFIDMGGYNTELIILKDGDIAFYRKLPIAADDFTKSMTGILVSDRGQIKLTMAEAEKIKRQVGIPAESDSRLIDGKISAMQVLSMLRMPLDQLSGEISRCLDYYREETGGGRVEHIVLSGGGAGLAGLTKFLSDELGVEVKLLNPLDYLKMEKDAVREKELISHRLALAAGSALTEAKGINLLPAEIKEAARRFIARGTIEVIATAVIIISILVFIGMKIKLVNFEKRIAVAKMEYSSLQPQLKKAEAQSLANKALLDEPQWEDIFIELSNVMPENIHIENLKMQNNVITIKGVVAGEDAERALSDFVLTLERGIFSNVKLVRSRRLEGKAGVEFELRCWVDYE